MKRLRGEYRATRGRPCAASGSPPPCSRLSWPPKARHSRMNPRSPNATAPKDTADETCSHRLHRPHRSGQELERRTQHDPRRHAWAATRCKAAVERAGVAPGAVEDVLMGCANPKGPPAGTSPARSRCAPAAGQRAGATVNRFCSSGLQTIAMAAQRRHRRRRRCLCRRRRREHFLRAEPRQPAHALDPWLAMQHKPEIYWPMLQTAETVAKRYGIDRERMDATARRASSALPPRRTAGKFDDEIVPITVTRRCRRSRHAAARHAR
jgi:acetyl-CoA acetyltransferase